MNNAKKQASAPKPEIPRENLIVPEEIFAPTEDEAAHEEEIELIPDPDTAEPTDGHTEAEGPTDEVKDGQISFFDDEITDPNEKTNASEDESAEKKSDRIIMFEEKDEAGFDPEAPRLIDRIFDFVELFTLTVAAVFLLTTLLFRHAIVDGDSMVGTLINGEHLIISDLFYTPERGDVIVFEDYSLDENLRKPIVKRVIALAGDVVRIDFYGEVYVNGKKIDESAYKYLLGGTYEIHSDHTYATLEEYTVPEGHIFVLGDNRNNSTDSRCFGAISTETILGQVKLRIFPFGKIGTVD